MVFPDVFTNRRIRRLELMTLVLVEQVTEGSMTPEHQELLSKLASELLEDVSVDARATDP
jgi:hypothetical protein